MDAFICSDRSVGNAKPRGLEDVKGQDLIQMGLCVCMCVCLRSHLSWDQQESKEDVEWREGKVDLWKKNQDVQKLWVPKAFQELKKKRKASGAAFSPHKGWEFCEFTQEFVGHVEVFGFYSKDKKSY